VPGYIKTKMTENSFNNIKARNLRTKRTINQKWGRPRDLVGAAIFLSSTASEYINGQDIIIDGGWSAKGL
jgi:NAD(P)-dependent dehydrogenase (short-subunit alcohol dehydrogenase family)